MKLTAQEEYGLRCLLRVAEAGEGESLTIPEIGRAEALSIAYVAKLMRILGIREECSGPDRRVYAGAPP